MLGMTKSLSMKLGKALDKSWRGQQKADNGESELVFGFSFFLCNVNIILCQK